MHRNVLLITLVLTCGVLPLRAEELTLASVLRRTVEHGPAIRAARERWLAAGQRRPQVVALPDPRAVVMPYLRKMTDDDEEVDFQITQEVTHPRRRAVAGRLADQEVRAADLRHQIAIRNAIADAKEAYFELYYIDRAADVTREVARLYERYAALAAGGIEPGGPRLPETFRAEAQRSQLAYDLVLLSRMREAEAARLRATMGEGPAVVVGRPREVPEPAGEIPPFQKLETVALARSQELAAAGVEVDRAKEQVTQARLLRTPDFMVGAQYMRTGGEDMPGGDPTRDPFRLELGVTLPIWRTKIRAAIDEARHAEAAARADLDAQRLTVESDLSRAYFVLGTAARLVRLYRDTLIPQARQALQSAEALHRTGAASMLAVIETTSTFHNFELARLRATADYYQNVARIEKILGTALEIDEKPAAEKEK